MNKTISAFGVQPSLVEKALTIASIAHHGQVRKTDQTPYLVHPVMVAFKLKSHNFPEEVVAAGLVHDVIEDTDYKIVDIKKHLGDSVASIVWTLSENKDLIWEDRKAQFAEKIKNASDDAKAVVVADKIHNMECLIAHHRENGPRTWDKFNRGREKKIWFESLVLDSLKKTWNHPMIDEYEKLLNHLKDLD